MWNSSGEGGGPDEIGSFAIIDIAEADVFDQVRVDLGLRDHFLQLGVDKVIEFCVFKAALASFCERRAEGEGYDDVVRILLRAG